MPQDTRHKLTITMTQETGDVIDNRTLTEDFSADTSVHLIKTQVFTEELAKAMINITKRLTDMALVTKTGNGKNK